MRKLVGVRTEKRCPDCKATKPAVEFGRNNSKSSADKLQSTCKECSRKRSAAYQEANLERTRAYGRARYQELRERLLAYVRERRKDPAIKQRARNYSAQWRREHPEEFAAKREAWKKANPEKVRQQHRAKVARRARVKPEHTLEQWDVIVEIFDSRCAYCLKKLDSPTADHVIALSRGGTDNADNIVPACGSCNSTKSAKPIWAMVNVKSAYL